MNYSIGVNRAKELNEIIKRVKIPKLSQNEECIYSCDDDYINYADEYDVDDKCCNIKEMFKFDSKVVMYLGLGIVVGVLGTYLLKK